MRCPVSCLAYSIHEEHIQAAVSHFTASCLASPGSEDTNGTSGSPTHTF